MESYMTQSDIISKKLLQKTLSLYGGVSLDTSMAGLDLEAWLSINSHQLDWSGWIWTCQTEGQQQYCNYSLQEGSERSLV